MIEYKSLYNYINLVEKDEEEDLDQIRDWLGYQDYIYLSMVSLLIILNVASIIYSKKMKSQSWALFILQILILTESVTFIVMDIGNAKLLSNGNTSFPLPMLIVTYIQTVSGQAAHWLFILRYFTVTVSMQQMLRGEPKPKVLAAIYIIKILGIVYLIITQIVSVHYFFVFLNTDKTVHERLHGLKINESIRSATGIMQALSIIFMLDSLRRLNQLIKSSPTLRMNKGYMRFHCFMYTLNFIVKFSINVELIVYLRQLEDPPYYTAQSLVENILYFSVEYFMVYNFFKFSKPSSVEVNYHDSGMMLLQIRISGKLAYERKIHSRQSRQIVKFDDDNSEENEKIEQMKLIEENQQMRSLKHLHENSFDSADLRDKIFCSFLDGNACEELKSTDIGQQLDEIVVDEPEVTNTNEVRTETIGESQSYHASRFSSLSSSTINSL